ncbi:MAG: ATP-grasp domain-containing protein [Bacilli bacterium]
MKNFIFVSPNFPETYWRFCLALKNRGFNVLGIGDAPYNEIPEGCKFSLTEYYCCPNMDNYENEKRAVQYFIDKYGPIDFIESNNEFWLEKDAHLRSDFNIPNGIRFEEINKFKLKSEEKKYYEEAGCKVARYCLANSLNDVLKLGKECGYPLFAKPNNGVGAQGTYKIENENDVKKFFSEKPKGVEYIVEEYVNGCIVSFDGVSNSKGDVIFEASNVFTPSCADIVKLNLDDMYYCLPKVPDDLHKIGTKVIKAFNVQNRFFHCEYFRLLEDHPYLGKKGSIVALEANMRPAGGYTPDLIDFANSISVYDVYADSIAYDENREDLTKEKFYAITSSRRNAIKYTHSPDDIFEKYRNDICMYGNYPKAISDDMGDYYFFAKFKTLKEAQDFDEFVRQKI